MNERTGGNPFWRVRVSASKVLVAGVMLGLVLSIAAGCSHDGINPRSLHYTDGTLVASRPVSPVGYEAYLRARLALDADPPRLEEAAEAIDQALRFDPRDPHLWTTKALIEHELGNDPVALDYLRTALDIRPDYPPALDLAAHIGEHGASRTRTANRRGQSDGQPQ